MREFPVFVPVDGDHISAVVAVPDTEPKGLVLMLPGGGGAPRSHHFSLWTRVARALAEQGIASIRTDWRGVGDSTGAARFSLRILPGDDVVAMARFAMRATGVRRLGLTGNCGGARTVMQAARSLPECEGVALLLVKPLVDNQSTSRAAVWTRSTISRTPVVGRLAKDIYWKLRRGRSDPITEQLKTLRGSTHILLMEPDTVKAGKLPQFVSAAKRSNGAYRVDIKDLPGGKVREFQSIERQDYVVRSLVDWFDQTFASSTVAPPRARRPAAQAR